MNETNSPSSDDTAGSETPLTSERVTGLLQVRPEAGRPPKAAPKLGSLLKRIAAVVTAVIALLAGAATIAQYIEDHMRGGPQQIVTTTPPPTEPTSAEVTVEPRPSFPPPTPLTVTAADELFRDDFSSITSGWDNYSKENASTGYEDGRYFIQLDMRDVLWLSVWKKPAKIDNGVLQVDIQGPFGEGGARTQGLAFGWRQNWEGSTYAFTVDVNGVCSMLEATGGWYTRATGSLKDFNAARSYHTLRVQIRGREAVGYVDGTFCVAYEMDNYHSGYVGLVASGWKGNGKSYFDEFRIFRLP